MDFIKEKKIEKMRKSLAYLLGLGLIALTVGALYVSVPLLSRVFEPKATLSPKLSPSALEEAKEKPVKDEIRVMAVGDMIFDRRVKRLIEEEGGCAPLAKVASLLKEADLTLANLESPLAQGGVRLAHKDVTFRGDIRAIEGIKAAGIDYVSLANNHALDYGKEALLETIELLKGANIAHSGAGMNEKEALRPAFLKSGEKIVAVLAFTYVVPAGFVPSENRAGVAFARPPFDPVIDAIKAADERADYIFVSYHYGSEYTDYPLAYQKELARRSIDAGADLIFAHHPHVIQGVEVYKGKVIAYSLGDFVFDHFSRKTGEAFILDLVMDEEKTKSIEIIPVYLDNDGSPAVVKEAEALIILKRLAAISKGLGTEIIISGDIGRIDIMEVRD